MSDHVKSTAALGENVSQVSSASNTNSNIVAKCIFCKIVRREADATTVFENDQFLAFRDIYPASDKHYLVIPKNHICGVNDLTADDIPLVEQMKDIALQVMQQDGYSTEQIRLGFHQPPFITVHHLHLHSIAPISKMSWVKHLMFKPNSFWFKDVETIIDNLRGRSTR